MRHVQVVQYKFSFFLFGVLILFSIIINASCRHKAVIPDSPSISFTNEVQPIILGSCALSGCHALPAEIQLEDYAGVMDYVKAGNAYQSKLYKAITSLGPNRMPPTQPLSEEQLKLIYVWIQQGAKNN